MMAVVVATGAIRRAKLQSNHQQIKSTPSFLRAGRSSCRPTDSFKALQGKRITFHGRDHPSPAGACIKLP